jgi:hypothetical protein
MAVLFCGDFYQLPPVSGMALYDTSDAAAAAGDDAQAGFAAWAALTHVIMLKTNYRAAGDPTFIALLRRLRAHAVTDADVVALKGCRVTTTRMPSVDTAMAWYTNDDVNATNCSTVHHAAAAAGVDVCRLTAEARPTKRDDTVPADGPAHAGWVVGSRKSSRGDLLYSHLDVYVGCPVTMYVNNKLTKHSVARGSRGYVVGSSPPLEAVPADEVDITLPTASTHKVRRLRSLPDVLFVYVPGSTVKFAGLPESVFPVKHTASKLHVHGHRDKVHVTQFPIKLNFAWTCHKLQGKTEPSVVLGCTNRGLNYNYTAISRTKSLKTLHILKNVELSRSMFNSPGTGNKYDMLVAEMNRLDALSAITMQLFGH